MTEDPYHRVRVRVLASTTGGSEAEIARLRDELARLLALKHKLGGPMPTEITKFLSKVDDLEAFVDLAAFSLCDSPRLKQDLLETLDLRERLQLFGRRLRTEIGAFKLQRHLESGLSAEDIARN